MMYILEYEDWVFFNEKGFDSKSIKELKETYGLTSQEEVISIISEILEMEINDAKEHEE